MRGGSLVVIDHDNNETVLSNAPHFHLFFAEVACSEFTRNAFCPRFCGAAVRKKDSQSFFAFAQINTHN